MSSDSFHVSHVILSKEHLENAFGTIVVKRFCCASTSLHLKSGVSTINFAFGSEA